MQSVVKVQALLGLGVPSLLRVGTYRLALRSGLHASQRLQDTVAEPPYFSAPTDLLRNLPPASTTWQDEAELFAFHRFPLAGIPDWHANLFRPGVRHDKSLPWHAIPDYDQAFGDIKCVWDLSRMDWLLAMAQRAAKGDAAELERLNIWLADWCRNNPPYFGANWKCGQEASIRVMHLAAAALLLDQVSTALPGLRHLIATHLKRIRPTLSYAIGQDNNHGVSEAAALFVGGSWLARAGDPAGQSFERLGRRWLENRADHLFLSDGTSSQQSVVYHRMKLDAFSLAEVWRRKLALASFSQNFQDKLAVATQWLWHMVEPSSGDAPNLGANDGARLLPLTDSAYRDFRPTLQLAANLFCNTRAITATGPWDDHGRWLGVPPATRTVPPLRATSLDAGGYHVLHAGSATAVLRYPRFYFRPNQADVLHADLWSGDRNILRDAGTYSYNAPIDTYEYFAGTRGHNSVMFDGREQMPRVSRYLFGHWLKAEDVLLATEQEGAWHAAAAYVDHAGARHHRKISLSPSTFTCVDQLSGTAKTAVLRWRLEPGHWQQQGSTFRKDGVEITITSDRAARRLELVEGEESRHYLEKTAVPVLEAEFTVPARISTHVTF